jgi:hypothetical protein
MRTHPPFRRPRRFRFGVPTAERSRERRPSGGAPKSVPLGAPTIHSVFDGSPHDDLGRKFLEACERIDPESEAIHRRVALECVAAILGDEASAEVFLLALDGLLADQSSMEVLEQRTQLLAARFAPRSSKKGARS